MYSISYNNNGLDDTRSMFLVPEIRGIPYNIPIIRMRRQVSCSQDLAHMATYHKQ
mgnify:CR=1 FL=1